MANADTVRNATNMKTHQRSTVVHIITGLNVGGAERALHTLLAGGLHGAYDNEVVSLMDEGHYGPLIRQLGVRVHSLGMPGGRPNFAGSIALVKLIKRNKPDIIQGWMYHGNLAAFCAARLARHSAKIVWNVRSSLDNLGGEKYLTQMIIRASRPISWSVEANIFVSSVSRSQHEAFGYSPSNGLVIPNGFDLNRWRPDFGDRTAVRRSLGLTSHDLVLGYVGRFHSMKDQPNLLRALRPVMDAIPNLNVVFIGRQVGPDNPALQPFIRALPQGRLRFLGERDDIPFLVRGFDLHCLCSAWGEGFPNVLGEAMASGVPCITTDVGESRFIVGDTGFLVPPSDPSALAEMLSSALTEPADERIERGRRARQRIEAQFSLTKTLGAYKTLYDTVLRQNAS